MKPTLQEHVDLARLTTFKIGGTARYFTEVTKAEELKDVFAWIKSEQIPYFILSGGSNTIFDDGELYWIRHYHCQYSGDERLGGSCKWPIHLYATCRRSYAWYFGFAQG